MSYTVKQLATLAGVSSRTLHYYDEIGLLKPETVGANGYRYYRQESILRLQQILFYRELGVPLETIGEILARPDFDALQALEAHRKALQHQSERLARLIQTVDDTISHVKGERKMSEKQLLAAFSEEQQDEYAREAEQMYDPKTVRESNRKWKSYSAEKKQAILEEGQRVYTDLIAAMPKGAASPEVQACIARWRENMSYFWTPNLDQLVGLSELYNQDPRFKANFDQMHPQLAEFMRQAVAIYVENNRK
jgi:DNA-binding transcriptional MerR regulator